MKNNLLVVSFDDETNRYSIEIPKGSSVPETVFSFAIVVKCWLRDGVIKETGDIFKMLDKYVNDPQYEEVKEDDENVSKSSDEQTGDVQ